MARELRGHVEGAAVASSDAQPLAATTTSRNKNCLTSQLLEGIGGPACTRGPSRGASQTLTSCGSLTCSFFAFVLKALIQRCLNFASVSLLAFFVDAARGPPPQLDSWMGVRKMESAWPGLVPHGPWRLCCLCWQPVGDDIESHGVAVGDCIVCDWPIHWECAKELPNICGRRNRLEESDDARSASDRPSPLHKTE